MVKQIEEEPENKGSCHVDNNKYTTSYILDANGNMETLI